MKREPRKHIRYLFVNRPKYAKSYFDLGLLTDDFTFYQCSILTHYKSITTNLWLKLRRAFRPFLFSNTTDVIIVNNITVWEPISYYLKILQEQLHFNLKFVDELRVPKRIASFHRGYLPGKLASKIRMPDIYRLWDKIIKNERCPWITEDVNQALLMSYKSFKVRTIYIRMALYYMVIKENLYQKYLNSYGQRKLRNLLTDDEKRQLELQNV